MEGRARDVECIAAVAGPVFARHGIAEAWLFGSRARGEAREDSDYDFLCRIDRTSGPFGFKALGELCIELEHALKGAVQIVEDPFDPVRNASLAANIERDKVKVYEREEQ